MLPREPLHEPCHSPGASADGRVTRQSLAHVCFRITPEAFDAFRRAGFGPRCSGSGDRTFATDAAVDAWFGSPWRSREREMLAELQHLHPA
ncbi:hypothetical protein [Methylorubrum sp. SL192]|uniref:hypothetical protein n=1 Tax=Methylorubrum sp. SL192 TaxID=2995167 RepID=UPI0022738306|nr:hypothetical protein [Methylorubrum sp. SL192]MCY1642128.1 hypothetical protein [Methylorubrum sp. SL192]